MFDDSVKQFKTDLPALQEQLTTELKNTANSVVKTIGAEAGRGVVAATQSIVEQLETAAQKAKQQLLHDQATFLRNKKK